MGVANFSHEGFTINYTHSAAVVSGDVVDMGSFVGVAVRDADADVEAAYQIEGVYDVTKYTGEAINFGATVYWDEGTKTATGTVGYSEAVMGRCVKAALAGDARVLVKLMPALG